MPAYRTLGTDSSGRPIRMSPTFSAAWEDVVSSLGWRPVITQGGWMGDLAASASGSTHDGDAADIRVRDLTTNQVNALVRTLRAHGVAAWLRNRTHGGFSDPHVHAVPGRWAHPSPSALRQWDSCKAGRDGLRSNGPDYHPYPLAPRPPEDDMADAKDEILAALAEARKAIGLRVTREADRTIAALTAENATLRAELAEARKAIGLRVSAEADRVIAAKG